MTAPHPEWIRRSLTGDQPPETLLAALPPQQRVRAQNWLRMQEANRRDAQESAQAYDARAQALRQQREEDAVLATARLRARQCPDCFQVRTPANTCQCNPG